MPALFSIPVRVYYEDTDAGGVVYYANYLKFMERARTEWLRALGFEQTELASNERVLFAVRAVRTEFVKPARFNDSLEVTVELAKAGNASLVFNQEVRRDGAALCQGEVKVACLDSDTFKPKPIPTQIIARLQQWRTT